MTAFDFEYTPATTLAEANQDLADALEIARLALEEAERRNAESAAPTTRQVALGFIRGALREAAVRTSHLPDLEPPEPEGNAS